VIGMSGLEQELREEGITHLGGSVSVCTYYYTYPLIFPNQDPADCTLASFSLSDFTLDPDVGAVVCGLDTQVTYIKYSKAFQYLTRNPGCHFIATNEDSTYPSAYGLLPGAGSVSAPLRYALGRDPVCTGKPSTTMLDCINAKCVLCL
jgi:4-nitrophenyl phosphatase